MAGEKRIPKRCIRRVLKMSQIYVEEYKRISQNKKRIEKELGIKISLKDNVLTFEAKPEDELKITQFFDALNIGFRLNDALLIKEEDMSFEKINIKDVTKRGNLKTIRGRILGTHGKAIETLSNLTDCKISLHDSSVGIIGRTEDVARGSEALKRIIKGSKHGHVFAFLEEQRALEKGQL